MGHRKTSRSRNAAAITAARRGAAPAVSDEIVTYVQQYNPTGINQAGWERVSKVVREAVLAAPPHSADHARTMLRPAALVAIWAVEHDIDCTTEAIFCDRVVEEWTARQISGGASERSISTYRSRLRTIIGVTRPVTEVSRAKLAAPYTESEDLGLRRTVVGQRTDGYRSQACLLYGLARGAGMSSTGIGKLILGDVDISDPEGVKVQTGGRTLWVLDNLVGVVRTGVEASQRSDARYAVGDIDGARRSVSRIAQKIHYPNGVPALSVARARSTWIVDHLNRGTPPALLAETLGVTSVRFVDDLLEHCKPTDNRDRERLLRGRA